MQLYFAIADHRRRGLAGSAAALRSLAFALVFALFADAAMAEPSAGAASELRPLRMEAGTWDADITFPAQEPGGKSSSAKGVQVNTLRSNGMWMLNEFSVDGTPYQGTGLWGWDGASKSYVGSWGDNNENRMRLDKGVWDESVQTMTWSSETIQSDGSRAPLSFTETFRGDVREFDMVLVGPKSGKRYPLVHMVFRRRA